MSNFQNDPDSVNPETPPSRELVYEYLGTSEPTANFASHSTNVPPAGSFPPMQAEQRPQQEPIVIRTSPLSILLFVLCFLLALFLIPNIAQQISYSLTRGSERAKAEIAAEFLKAIPDNKQIIPWVVKNTAPSVVSVKVIGNVQSDETTIRNVPVGQGSGIIVDKDGYIVTNHHVIRDSHNYRVSLSDGRETDNVRLVGLDPITDLAVLKINLSEIMPITWGDSNSLEVGESVLAIGSPYSFANTVTCGIISAKERYAQEFEMPFRMQPQEYLQTDAAVNPGNSGGPLINMQGEVIGINTMILGETYRGICFAIPSTLAKRVYEEIREKGRVTYGQLGIYMSDLPVTDSRDEGNRSIGVRVTSIVPGGAAEKAGMLADDVITNWNGLEIRGYVQLNHAILFTPPGTTVKVTCLRDNKPIEFEVTVDQRPVRRFR